MKSSILVIILLILVFSLIWYIYNNDWRQLWKNLYNINMFYILGFTIFVIFFTIIIIFSIVKEGMTNSTISSTDPMVISQTTAGAIKTIHDQLQPIQLTQDILNDLNDAVNNQSDQISILQQNSTSYSS